METKIEQIKTVIEEVRPFLQRDGGDIAFVKFEDGIVYVDLRGACAGCASMEMTLKSGVEFFVKERLDFVDEVTLANPEDLWSDFL